MPAASNNMSVLRFMIALVGTYVFAWTASFIFMFASRDEATPWDLYFPYLRVAWTFRAGEIPSFIWLYSVVVFVPLSTLVVIVLRRLGR